MSTLSALIASDDPASPVVPSTAVKTEALNESSADAMPELKHLVMSSLSASSTQAVPEPPEPDSQLDDIDALLAQFTPHSTDLGRAMDDLRLRWTELISSTTIGVGLTAPGQEHLKEHAEFASAELREAARAADAQLARVALRWRRANPEIAKKQELENLKQAIERQEALLNRTENQFTRRLHEFQGDNSNVQ